MNNKDLKACIVFLKEQGWTDRQIAVKVFNRETMRSTVNDILRREGMTKTKKAPVKVEVEVEEENTPQINEFKENKPFVFKIVTSTGEAPEGSKHYVLPDCQIKPNSNTEFLKWVGQNIVEEKPEVLVCLGDFGDIPSLSSYDKGKKAAEGKRLHLDIKATVEAMRVLLEPLYDLQQQELEEYGEVKYKPKMVLTMGNHEDRINRHVESNPELSGLVSTDALRYSDFGWEVAEFLVPVTVNGVSYVHFAANPFTGKPYSGSALNILQKVGISMTVGHKQTLDIATRNLPTTGQQQWFVCAGACYTDDEGYKGPQGNRHFRGIIVKHGVSEGGYSPMFINLDYLQSLYGGEEF